MQKWEYLSMSFEYFNVKDKREWFLEINGKLTVIPAGEFKPLEIVNRLGEEGWELVIGDQGFTVHTSVTKGSLIFKRPKE